MNVDNGHKRVIESSPSIPSPVAKKEKKKGAFSLSFHEVIYEFIKQLEEGRNTFVPVIRYLQNNFHHQFNYRSLPALQRLHAIATNTQSVLASYVYQYLHKDDSYFFGKLPRDIRCKIYRYLKNWDYRAAKEMVRGNLQQFNLDWMNSSKPFIDMTAPAQAIFLKVYGNELKHVELDGKSYVQMEKILKHTPNLVHFSTCKYSTQNVLPLFRFFREDKLQGLSFFCHNPFEFKNYSILLNFTALTKLKIGNCGYGKIDFLRTFPHLTDLKLDYTAQGSLTRDLLALTQLVKLKIKQVFLTIANGKSLDLSCLINLSSLEIQLCHIHSNYAGFSGLTKLRRLNLGYNELKSKTLIAT